MLLPSDLARAITPGRDAEAHAAPLPETQEDLDLLLGWGFVTRKEYDGRADTIRFIGNAVVRRMRGTVVVDEVALEARGHAPSAAEFRAWASQHLDVEIGVALRGVDASPSPIHFASPCRHTYIAARLRVEQQARIGGARWSRLIRTRRRTQGSQRAQIAMLWLWQQGWRRRY